jgi:hypothetical protein
MERKVSMEGCVPSENNNKLEINVNQHSKPRNKCKYSTRGFEC